jgi:hypothetical protein
MLPQPLEATAAGSGSTCSHSRWKRLYMLPQPLHAATAAGSGSTCCHSRYTQPQPLEAALHAATAAGSGSTRSHSRWKRLYMWRRLHRRCCVVDAAARRVVRLWKSRLPSAAPACRVPFMVKSAAAQIAAESGATSGGGSGSRRAERRSGPDRPTSQAGRRERR